MIKVLAIPYSTFKERVRLIRQLEKAGFKVEYDENFIYAEKHYKFLKNRILKLASLYIKGVLSCKYILGGN